MFWAIKKYSLNFAMGRPAHFPRAGLILVSALWGCFNLLFSAFWSILSTCIYYLFYIYIISLYFTVYRKTPNAQKKRFACVKTECVDFKK